MQRFLKTTLLIGTALATAGCGLIGGDQDDDGETVVLTGNDTGVSQNQGNNGDAGPGGKADGSDSGWNVGQDGGQGGTTDSGQSGRQDGGQGGPDDAGSSNPGQEGIPALGNGRDGLDAIRVTTIADQNYGLNGPRDLEFNPEADGQLWVVNRNDHSTVVLKKTGSDQQTYQKFNNFGARHFLAKPAALAFGQPGFMATAQQEDEKTQSTTPPDFMGPTLWTTDLSTFDGGHGGHMDMLHNSPLASGIAWETGNAYWVLDGYHGALTRYDFKMDHGPGGSDHTDGVVRRYVDGQVGIKEGVVAHVAMNREAGLLYAADTGNNRIAVLDTSTGSVGPRIMPNYDRTDQAKVVGAELTTVVDGNAAGLQAPAGLELHDGHLYVSDNATSTIYAFKANGTNQAELVDSMDVSRFVEAGSMQGLALDGEGNIYVADAANNRVLRLAPLQESTQ